MSGEATDATPDVERCVSVVMPAYNEEATIAECLHAVLASPLTAQVLVVDDRSTDATASIVLDIAATDPRVELRSHDVNQGKGAALHTGFAAASQPFVLVQDADLEYDPAEYGVLLEPLLDGRADVVFGSRFHGARPHRVLYFWHTVGNRLLTLLSNAFTDLNLTDMETCYKMFRREVVQSITIESRRFGIEPEITAKVARRGYRIFEVPISYYGRTYAEGKKIGWRDGFRAFYCIVKYSPLLARRRSGR